MSECEIFEPVDHITVWVDGGIHIKTRDPSGDPVEMSAQEAADLAALLNRLATELS